MGHLLNKVLKDLVVRSLTMRGFDSPYVPGWDCHGLPIEHKVMKDLGSKAAGMDNAEIRALCHDEAMKWVDVQRDQFRRLGIEGDWDHPYLTLDPRYEAGIIDVLADLLETGLRLPPAQADPLVHPGPHRPGRGRAGIPGRDLAQHLRQLPDGLRRARTSWGDRPLARDDLDDDALDPARPTSPSPPIPTSNTRASATSIPTSGQTVQTILAAELVAKVMELAEGRPSSTEVGRCQGRGPGACSVPPRRSSIAISPIVLADYVSVEDGTGLVHTAPGHGAEDYQTGQRYGLPTLSPVDASAGSPTRPPPALVGQGGLRGQSRDRRDAPRVGASLSTSFSFAHSYPHCWRCKKPVIFRATEQWFIGVDRNDLRGRTLKAIDERDLASRLGQVADRRDGRRPPRLVHQPPAVLGRADPRAGLRDLRRPSS